MLHAAPLQVTDLEEVCRAQAPTAHGSSRLGSAGRPGRSSMLLTPLGLAPSGADASSGSEGGASGGPALTSSASMRRRPALSIQVAGDEDGASSPGPLTAGSKVSFAPLSPSKAPGQGLFPGLQNVLKGTMSAAAMAATPKAGRDGTWGGSGVRAKVWQDVAAARESADTASTSGGAVSAGGGSPQDETNVPATTPGGRKRSMFGGAQQLPNVLSEYSDFSSDCKTPQDRRGTNNVRFAGGAASHSKEAAAGEDAGAGDDSSWASKRSSMAGPLAPPSTTAAKGVRFSAAGGSARPPSRSGLGSASADGSGGGEDLEPPSFEAAVAGSRALGSTSGAAYFLQRLSEGAESVNLSVLGKFGEGMHISGQDVWLHIPTSDHPQDSVSVQQQQHLACSSTTSGLHAVEWALTTTCQLWAGDQGLNDTAQWHLPLPTPAVLLMHLSMQACLTFRCSCCGSTPCPFWQPLTTASGSCPARKQRCLP